MTTQFGGGSYQHSQKYGLAQKKNKSMMFVDVSSELIKKIKKLNRHQFLFWLEQFCG